MRAITTHLYSYAELPAESQARARDWMREQMAGDNTFAEFVTLEFRDLLRQLGFTVKSEQITWSGFASQGDGAAFAGYWNAEGCNVAAWLAERPCSFTDSLGVPQICESNIAWHRAAGPIASMAVQFPKATATIETPTRGRGHHMIIEDCDFGVASESPQPHATAQATLTQMVRDLAAAYYRALETDYDYSMSDESIAQDITANEYEFTHYGRIYAGGGE